MSLDLSALQTQREPRHRISLLRNDFEALIEELLDARQAALRVCLTCGEPVACSVCLENQDDV
jgi:hypothetical protein